VKKICRAAALLLATAFVSTIAGCGGGGGGQIVPVVFNITTTTLPDGVVGVAYNQTLTVTGGFGAKTFSVSAGDLPAGLALNASSGAITGIPTGPVGTANFTVKVMDSSTPPQSDSQALTIDVVNPLNITTTTLPGTAVGATYNQTIAATGGTTPYAFSISAGALPAGLSLNTATGAITGSATAAATSQTFTVRVADGSTPQLIDTQVLTIAVALELTTTSLPDATSGTLYSQTLQAQGGTPPYAWARTAGSMPAGIADPVAATGVITGTPSAVCIATTSAFTARVTDSAVPPVSDTQAGLGITVNPGPALNITTTTMPNGVVGTPYSVIVQATGGAQPYSFAASGTLPSQLGPIDATTGAIAGTPDTVETRTFNVTVTDFCGTTDTQTLTVTINALSLGRNDTIGNATTLGNGTFAASISPSGNPNTILDPDEDFYRITTTANSTVTIDINAQVNGSPLDSVIEIVNAAGTQLTTCGSPTFTSACESDDETLGVALDSLLQIRVLGATTFYVHVVDFRGDARPDMKYDIVISGVN
jgi:hypothetical protein